MILLFLGGTRFVGKTMVLSKRWKNEIGMRISIQADTSRGSSEHLYGC